MNAKEAAYLGRFLFTLPQWIRYVQAAKLNIPGPTQEEK